MENHARSNKAAASRVVDSNAERSRFEIYMHSSEFPCASIAWGDDGVQLHSTDLKDETAAVKPHEAVDDWVRNHFPHLVPAYTDWARIAKEEECANRELPLPSASICTQDNRIVIHDGGATLYAELANDHYHFTYGATIWNDEKNNTDFCEFSLRHIYIIDKALPILHKHLNMSVADQQRLQPKFDLIRRWLDERHVKPPAPKVNVEAGQQHKPEKVKSPLHKIKTQQNNRIESLLTQIEYDNLMLHIEDAGLENYEWGDEGRSRWDWFVAQNGQPFVVYFGGKKENILGAGGFSEVRFCQSLTTGLWYGVKVQSSERLANEKIDIEEYLLGLQGIYYSTCTIARLNLRLSIEKILNACPVSQVVRPNPSAFFKKEPEKERFKKTCILIENLYKTVQSLHACGYLHRDIKMENILLNPETLETYLIDFGAAELSDKKGALICDCREVHSVSTPNYNAPELAISTALEKNRYVYSEATEMYAIGKIIGEMVCNCEGFDITKYRADILGAADQEDLTKMETFQSYINYWIAKFIPDNQVGLNAKHFVDSKGGMRYPHSSVHNHSGIRYIIEYTQRHPEAKGTQAALWRLASECVSHNPKHRPTFAKALSQIRRIADKIR